MTNLVHIPLDELKGKIYRSPMPFSTYDQQQSAYQEMKEQAVSVIVLLVPSEEARLLSGKDLLAFYQQEGLQVIHLPVPDFGVPGRSALHLAVQQTIHLAQAGHHIAVHCLGGCGRSGLFLVELVKAVKFLPPSLAVDFVRKWLPCAVENKTQLDFIYTNQQDAQ